MNNIKPLDLVETANGSLAMVSEVNLESKCCSIVIIRYGKDYGAHDKMAWWDFHLLKVIINLPHLISISMCNASGNNEKYVKEIYPAK